MENTETDQPQRDQISQQQKRPDNGDGWTTHDVFLSGMKNAPTCGAWFERGLRECQPILDSIVTNVIAVAISPSPDPATATR